MLLLLIQLFVLNSYGECVKKQIRIAVIDTGFGYNREPKHPKFCEYGHRDFTIDRNSEEAINDMHRLFGIPRDTDGHGTNIVGIIDNYAKKSYVNYCIVVLKIYSKNQTGEQTVDTSIKAIKYATELGVDTINYSGGGPNSSSKEKEAVIQFLDNGGTFVAAAGNNAERLGVEGSNYYPAMYDSRIVVVGNWTSFHKRSALSNYGSLVNRWEVGENVEVYGIVRTGTSQACAVATGKIISENNKCILKK
jgi:hypothetical protein